MSASTEPTANPKPSNHSTSADAKARLGALPVYPLIAIIVVVVIYYVSQIVAVSLVGIMPGLNALPNDSAALQFSYVVLVEALTLGALYWFMRGRKISFAQLGLVRPRLRDVGITLLAYPPYFFLNALATIGAAALFHLNTDQRQQTGFETAHSTTELLLTFVSLVILPPLVEEIVMRGFLFGSLKNGMKVVWAALLTSVIFAIAHLQPGNGAPLLWLAAIDTFVLSLVLCYLRQKTGSLWAGIGLHGLKNGLAFFVLFIAPQYPYFDNLWNAVITWTPWTR